MVVVEIENDAGYTLGAIRIEENNQDGEVEVENKTDNISICDYDFDNIFDTNDEKIRISINDSKTFRTSNYENVGHIPKECKQLVKEYNSYKILLEYFKNEMYYDCYIIIANYFGHINYGSQFGYFKTHDEICKILFECLLSSLDKNNSDDRFENFVNRMMRKIIWNLEHIHHYDIETNNFMEE